MAHPPVAPQSVFRRRNRWPIFATDADRSSSVSFTQHHSEAASLIPGYLSREANARTVLPNSDYARGELTRLEIKVYGSLTGPTTTRAGAPNLPDGMPVTRRCELCDTAPLSRHQLAKIRRPPTARGTVWLGGSAVRVGAAAGLLRCRGPAPAARPPAAAIIWPVPLLPPERRISAAGGPC